jgi:hypothetical protein
VRFNGIELGRPVDVLFDREVSRAVGLEVVCGDDERRFLPLSVATVDGDSIAIGSPFLLVDESGLSFYREEARTLRALRGARIDHQGVNGVLRDIVLGEDGTIDAVVLATGDGAKRVPRDGLRLSKGWAQADPTSSPRRS